MNNTELVRKLESVGKQGFVDHFELFQRYASGRVSKEDCIGTLVDEGVSNEAGAKIRAGNAKLIFESRREREALRIISESQRLSGRVVNDAIALSNELASKFRPLGD